MQAVLGLGWIAATVAFTVFWMVVGWRLMKAHEQIAYELRHLRAPGTSPIALR